MTDNEAGGNEKGWDFLIVWATSLTGSALLFLYVTRIIGYSGLSGFLYFTGFLISLILFFYIMGWPLYPGQKRFDIDE